MTEGDDHSEHRTEPIRGKSTHSALNQHTLAQELRKELKEIDWEHVRLHRAFPDIDLKSRADFDGLFGIKSELTLENLYEHVRGCF